MKTFFVALGCLTMLASSAVAQEPAAAAPQEPVAEVTAESIVEGETTSVEGTPCCGTKARRQVVRTRVAVVKSRVGTRRSRCCR